MLNWLLFNWGLTVIKLVIGNSGKNQRILFIQFNLYIRSYSWFVCACHIVIGERVTVDAVLTPRWFLVWAFTCMLMHTSWYILPVLRICPISKMIQTTPKLWPKFTRYTCRCLQGRHVGSFKTTLQGPWSNHWHDEKIYIVVNKLINRSIWYKNWKYKI